MKEPEGSTPSQFEDYLNVFKWLNSTISKSCRHIVNASETMMSWDNKPVCNLFPSVLLSVYVTLSWFLFHELSKARAYTLWYYTTSHVLPGKRNSISLHPAGRPVAASRCETFFRRPLQFGWFWLRVNIRERGRNRGKLRSFWNIAL